MTQTRRCRTRSCLPFSSGTCWVGTRPWGPVQNPEACPATVEGTSGVLKSERMAVKFIFSFTSDNSEVHPSSRIMVLLHLALILGLYMQSLSSLPPMDPATLLFLMSSQSNVIFSMSVLLSSLPCSLSSIVLTSILFSFLCLRMCVSIIFGCTDQLISTCSNAPLQR